ncbi:EAL domain-containing protein [Marinomonas ostreistagni]|uniref:EAL domain-containing protein n=1 Tax=Marinomonas ostreistagni TaxID=359209 RepID=UPI0019509E83|nr:EAL domain-containing protein [Marinomonas ostreistagni]MBM6550114.1 EAL domain-containing protein [Marinomonas ostreistagni]
MNSHPSGLSKRQLLDIIQKQRFGVEYQPIIDIQSGAVVAHEALSRFYSSEGESVRPDLVYAALHENPITLYQVEYAQKCLQLKHKPDTQLFVNLDQDAFFATDVEAINNPFVQLIRDYGQEQIVVELIENSELNDAIQSLSMIEAFDTLGIETALDDLCHPLSMISVSVLQLVGWVKLDRCVLRMQDKPVFMKFVRQMIQFARCTGKKIVLEGVETERDLEAARVLEVDYVQGYLFRPQFINIVP